MDVDDDWQYAHPRTVAGALQRGLGRGAEWATDWRQALRELRRRPPNPALLDLVDKLAAADIGYPLGTTVENLGALALPAARTWATSQPHRLFWTAQRLLPHTAPQPTSRH